MEDAAIVELYWQRQDQALHETKTKYGTYCGAIAHRILNDRQDAEECVNDTYLGAWNSIPPHRPANLKTFLGKITRNLSLKRWRSRSAAKRGSGEVALSFTELEDCISSSENAEEHLEAELTQEERRIFVCRYWYFDSIVDIATRFGFGTSKVKMSLKRTRNKLAIYLEREGVDL